MDPVEPALPADPLTAPPAAAGGTGAEGSAGAVEIASRETGRVLRGATVAPGLAMGVAHRKDYGLERAPTDRVARDQVEVELNRFRRSLDASRAQLEDLKVRLLGQVESRDAMILDTHLAYLKDSVFIADVENLILVEQMRLEAAIAKVVGDFDRIFRLVESDTLRQSAVDLRDVGIRVLRNLEAQEGGTVVEPRDYVLVAKELSIVDMFNLDNEHVRGIVTKEGGLTSHAAIFARSMRIPTVTGIETLLEDVKEGDFVILDATEAMLRINPDDRLRAQYAEGRAQGDEDLVAQDLLGEIKTADGEVVDLAASCGNLPEVEQAIAAGVGSIGLYRTELLYLADSHVPSREALTRHYASVLGAAQGRPVTFRLLSVDSSHGLNYLHSETERNPALGRVGIRALFDHEAVLRSQLRALLMAATDHELGIAIPFVLDCGDLRRVKEILFEERYELSKRQTMAKSVAVGVVIETPAALLGARDLVEEADFLTVNLDSLQQHLLATDRDYAHSSGTLKRLHPYVLRALRKLNEVAEGAGKELSAFGLSVANEENLPLLFGMGLRRFCLPSHEVAPAADFLSELDSDKMRRTARLAARCSSASEMRTAVDLTQRGYSG